MYIEKITSQHRRDFHAVYRCEHCDFTREGSGYDDDNFHRNVVPAMSCPECGGKAGPDYRPLGTKYAPGEVV